MKILECSSAGDKRFSAFYARVEAFGVSNNIEKHYQAVKYSNYNGRVVHTSKGQKVDFCVIKGNHLESRFLTQWYKLLWVKYLDAHPELVAFACTYDDFSDKFKGRAINCQADVIRQYIKVGRHSIIAECTELLTILHKKEDK